MAGQPFSAASVMTPFSAAARVASLLVFAALLLAADSTAASTLLRGRVEPYVTVLPSEEQPVLPPLVLPPAPTHEPAWYQQPCPSPYGCPCQFASCEPGVTHPSPFKFAGPPAPAAPVVPSDAALGSVPPLTPLTGNKPNCSEMNPDGTIPTWCEGHHEEQAKLARRSKLWERHEAREALRSASLSEAEAATEAEAMAGASASDAAGAAGAAGAAPAAAASASPATPAGQPAPPRLAAPAPMR